MKKIELYQCEVCGTQYKEKGKAEMCEKSHKIPRKIAGKRYVPMDLNQAGYPISISVLFEDGETITYKR